MKKIIIELDVDENSKRGDILYNSEWFYVEILKLHAAVKSFYLDPSSYNYFEDSENGSETDIYKSFLGNLEEDLRRVLEFKK